MERKEDGKTVKVYKYIQDNTGKEMWVEVKALVSVDGHQVIIGDQVSMTMCPQLTSLLVEVLHCKVTKSSFLTEMSFIIYLYELAVAILSLFLKLNSLHFLEWL